MEKRFYKEIWNIRFKKMLQLEKQSITAYQTLLDECKKKYKGHSVEPNLELLIKDEKKHVLLVEELISILNSQAKPPMTPVTDSTS